MFAGTLRSLLRPQAFADLPSLITPDSLAKIAAKIQRWSSAILQVFPDEKTEIEEVVELLLLSSEHLSSKGRREAVTTAVTELTPTPEHGDTDRWFLCTLACSAPQLAIACA